MKSRASSDNVSGISGGIPLPILSKACICKTEENTASYTMEVYAFYQEMTI
jgi:hypothetical protein